MLCSHFVKLATSIAVKDVSAPETLDLKNYFPDFLWLLRDAVLMVPLGRDGKPMTPTDSIKTYVLKRGSSFQETEDDKVGRAILTVFPTIECMTIQPPSSGPDSEVCYNIEAKQNHLKPRFNEQIECLIEYLLQHVQAKKGFVKGTLVDGPLLAAMATLFLEAVNNPDAIPCIANTWQAAVKVRCEKILDQMVQEYNQEMEIRIAEVGLPMEEDSLDERDLNRPNTLLGLHQFTLLQKTEFLMKQVERYVGDPLLSADGGMSVNTESLKVELEQRIAIFTVLDTVVSLQGKKGKKRKVTGGILYKFALHNHSESHSHCLALFNELHEQVKKKIDKGYREYSPDEIFKDLTAMQSKYYQRAIGPAKWEVYSEKESLIKLETEHYERLYSCQKKVLDAQQRVEELQRQMKSDAQLNQMRLEAMKSNIRKKYKDCVRNKTIEWPSFTETS